MTHAKRCLTKFINVWLAFQIRIHFPGSQLDLGLHFFWDILKHRYGLINHCRSVCLGLLSSWKVNLSLKSFAATNWFYSIIVMYLPPSMASFPVLSEENLHTTA
ncbi:hypothetical protein ATANTOWER_017430 [Ataeniobius toweri]|uniref:Uncharacterized protein n=1 Tax=Ataeniobius toweri TaxID=208326 RepID=A0ABU7BGQ5_9TELE|nr:hypothetical protein [Ataeniobius toweri]